jgi:hypothetical protein
LAGAFVREVNHTARKFVEKTVTGLSTKIELVRMAIEKEAQARIEPGTAEQFEVGKSRFEIKRRKHGERLVEFFDASTVVEKEQAVDEGSLASGKQDIFGAPFRLKKAMGWGECWTRGNDTMVRDAVEDYILAGASGEIVDGLKSLIGEPVEFERGMEGNDSIFPEGCRNAVAV